MKSHPGQDFGPEMGGGVCPSVGEYTRTLRYCCSCGGGAKVVVRNATGLTPSRIILSVLDPSYHGIRQHGNGGSRTA